MAEINFTSIADKIADVLEASTAITDYCMTTFGHDFTLFVGYDFANPPKETDCPMIVIHRKDMNGGEMTRKEVFNFEIVSVIVQPELQCKDSKRQEYSGIRQAEQLSRLVRNELKKLPPALRSSYSSAEHLDSDFHPMYSIAYDLRIEVQHCMGAKLEI